MNTRIDEQQVVVEDIQQQRDVYDDMVRFAPHILIQLSICILYTIKKWWYGIVSISFLRRIPFIRKKRIAHIHDTKKLLYALEGYMCHLKENHIPYPYYSSSFKRSYQPLNNGTLEERNNKRGNNTIDNSSINNINHESQHKKQ